MINENKKEKIEIYFDKECPFCNSYVNYLKLKDGYLLVLKNAREHKDELDFTKLDINKGFIVVYKDNFYQADMALKFINSIVKKDTFIGKMHFLFKYDNFFSRFLYKFLLIIRKLFLYSLKIKSNI
ncbi:MULTISPECIES: hypothetical protein [Aliarcobacter]|jgi:predicted DCC family thiol-disulfide oxidoreductase YuxK|uniref:DUF393 domain-containing protein n=1 Tax=Aliarcobacter skirrowii CCUG 10374 TaxID=1032239 RepID=A0AAD0SMU5_9BACT|nr:hypothetical protein [Aliarcobacter skirrowii]AXX85023.1 hypothetical protein ASKIR_1217 [Aliarcobacter skirrowii CCUG 10374]KAB0620815.1 hypothetical protein F7P70_06675 [Aliarcobacter skirrowii CCUG 10374]MDY0179732.1 hypothetical protein [Aliarcobacter skirrowii]RXI25841.1 hypothetical protein CP959_05935 [Aliarcobacter skirrowii CCUG 10374]SUU96454.1 Uncharacterised protein [Aliarcobacter skirrowii]